MSPVVCGEVLLQTEFGLPQPLIKVPVGDFGFLERVFLEQLGWD